MNTHGKDTIETVRRKIRSKCQTRGYLSDEIIEDITQDILVKWFVDKKNLSQTINHAITDWLRKSYGKTKAKYRRDSFLNSIDFDLLSNTIGKLEMGIEDRMAFYEMISPLVRFDKAILNLRFTYGYSLEEIANICDTSFETIGSEFSRIFKILRAIKERKDNFTKESDKKEISGHG